MLIFHERHTFTSVYKARLSEDINTIILHESDAVK